MLTRPRPVGHDITRPIGRYQARRPHSTHHDLEPLAVHADRAGPLHRIPARLCSQRFSAATVPGPPGPNPGFFVHTPDDCSRNWTLAPNPSQASRTVSTFVRSSWPRWPDAGSQTYFRIQPRPEVQPQVHDQGEPSAVRVGTDREMLRKWLRPAEIDAGKAATCHVRRTGSRASTARRIASQNRNIECGNNFLRVSSRDSIQAAVRAARQTHQLYRVAINLRGYCQFRRR
jgi:hypothetical protein